MLRRLDLELLLLLLLLLLLRALAGNDRLLGLADREALCSAIGV